MAKNASKAPKNKRPNKALELTTEWFFIILGTIIIASSVFFFLVPSHLAIASISGLAILMAKFLPLSVSTLTLILNVVCLLLAFLFVGSEFSGKTVVTSLIFPVVLWFWEKVLPDYQSIMGDQALDMVIYLFTVSFGIAMLFSRNASSGGIDIITMIMNKYLHIPLGKAMSIAGLCVSIPALFIYDIKTGVLSILGTYLNGIVLDHFLFGMNVKKKVCIVSEHCQEIRDFVINEMHSGATLSEITGGFDYKKHQQIEVLVLKNEYPVLMDYVAKVDSSAFITVYTVNEVHYTPKPFLEERV